MEDTSAFEHDTFKNYDRKTQDEFIDFWIDKNYANDEEYNASDDETKKAFKNALADKYAKADSYEGFFDTAVGYTKDALLGASTNIDAYGASINKGLDTILPDSVSKTLGLKENQKFWNDRKKLNEEHIENKYAGMAGEIILDPVNLTPAGIASKGSKAVRIAKSAGLGVGVGAATMVAKNYGNDELTNKQKTDEVLMSAGVVSVLNGIIAGVTKGRVTGAIKDVSDDLVGAKSSKEVADEIVKNADDLGLSKEEASDVATAVKTEKAFNAKEFLDKTKPPKLSSSVDADGVHIETQGTTAAKAEDELDQIDNGFDELVAEINNGEEVLTPKGYKEPEIIPEPKVELTPEQHLQKLDDDVREANRVAEYKDSIGATDEATKLKEEAKLKADEALQIRTAKAEELLTHPRAEELLQMRKDVLAKDTKSPQILTQKGAGRELDGYGGENKNTYDKASYDKNYNYDFELTKNDVANLQAGKVDGTLLSKLETDLDTLDNNPDYKPTDNKSGIDYSYKEPDNQIDDIDIDIKKYLDEDNAFQTDFRNKYKFTPTGSTKMDDYLVNEYKNNKPKNMSSSDWEEANTLFSKGIDNVAVATYAGVEEDENGNITFSPEKFLIGLGGYTAVKAAIKNKQVQGKLKEYAQKAIDTVDMNPAVYKENGFNAMSPVKSKSQKEKRGIFNVQNNDKKSTRILKDLDLVEESLKYEKGFQNQRTKKGMGALHIQKHIGNSNNGWVTTEELMNIGEAIRKVEPYNKDGKNIYEFYGDDKTRFRVVVGDDKVISFFSNRKAGKENNTLTYNYSNPSNETIIPQEVEKIKKDKNFKKWFKGSKLVDDAGEPLVVYHGTGADFVQFDKTKISRKKLGEGFYFAPNPASASRYAENSGVGMNVAPVYLSIKKPFDLSIEKNNNLWKKYDTKELSGKPFTDELKKQGYDGVISKNGNEIVAFEPTQIKSINNKGTFDKNNPNILHANGIHSMAGGFAGGSDSLINQRDYDGDGEFTYKDILAGVAAGTISINALKKMAPKLFEDGLKDGDNVAGMFVGTKPNAKGAFSDVASKKVMKEIDDSKAKVDFTPIKQLNNNINKPLEKRIEKLYGRYENGEFSLSEYTELENKLLNEMKTNNDGTFKLSRILKHDELFKNYPQLADTQLTLKDMPKGANGYYYAKANEIVLNSAMNKEDIKSALLHEIQHAIQNKEGWAKGGTPSNFKALNEDELRKEAQDIKDALFLKNPKNSIDDYEILSGNKISKRTKELSLWSEKELNDELINLEKNLNPFDSYQRLLGEQQARATQYRADMTPEQKASETWQDTLKRVEGEYKEPIVKFANDGMQEHAINVGKNSDTSIEDVNTILDKSSKPYIYKSLSDNTWKQEFNLKNVTDDATVTDVLGNDITITHDQMKKMLGKSRGHYLGLIKPTLQDPTMILKHKDADVYISRFYDENMKKYNLFAVSKDYKTGKLTLTSIVQRRNSQIKNKILEGEVTYVKDHGSVDGTSSSRVTPPDQSADSLKTIIAQKKEKGYEHVRKIVSDESLKEWGDVANSFKRNFTDTLSKEYHDIREKVTAKTNGDTIKLERLHNALNEFNEVDRKAIHEFVAGVNKNIDKNLLPLATKMKDDIHALSKSLVDRGVLGEAEFKEWENNYIHRSYEKHFMKDIKTLLSKGFKLDEIHKRGKIEMLSAKKVKEFRDSVKPEIFKRPLKDGGFRLKELPNGKFELRRDWTTAEREAMGEITDGAITIPETLMKLEQLNNNAKFLQEIEELDGVVLANGKDYTAKELEDAGYAIVPKDVKYGILSGKVIRHDVLNDIKGVKNELFNTFGNDGAMARVWKGYLSTWKKSKTVWNIPSHVNNFMSNAFLMHLAGMSAIEVTKSVGKAGKMMIHGNAYEELLKKKMLKTATAKNLKELEVMGEDLKYFIEAREGGLLGRSQLNDILAGQQNAPTKKGLLAGMDKFAQDAYHNGDAINRIAMYSHLRQKIKLEPDEARKMVLAVMPDYSKPMPAGYGWLRDSGVSPFISWTYYTMPTVIKMIRTKQGATQATKALATLSLLEWVLTGGEITPLDNVPFMDTKKPKDFKGRRFAISADKDKITTVKTDRWIPYVELLNPINFGISMFSGPTTKMVTNLGTLGSQNGMVDTYTGRPVTYASKSAGLRAYDYFKYLTQSYVPLPAQAYTGWNIGESMLKDKKKRKTNRVSTPRTPTQEALKFSGLNSLTYSKKGLKHEQRKDR